MKALLQRTGLVVLTIAVGTLAACASQEPSGKGETKMQPSCPVTDPPLGLAGYFTESWVIGRGNFAASIAYPLG